MGLGFFTQQAAVRPAVGLEPACGLCGLWKGCKSPKMKVAGQGRRGILVVGEAPGQTEDDQGKPFIGKAGQLLQRYLRAVGVDLFKDCWVANAARCRPKDNILPEKAIGHCRPFTVNDINELKPTAIILLGGSAIRSVIGWLWRESVGEVGRWVGWKIPAQRVNAWLCPTWHPSYLARQEGKRDYPLLEMLFIRHLKAAVQAADRGSPWETVPDYATQVQTTMDPDFAAHTIRCLMAEGTPLFSFDFETDRIKPDHPDARIICCAVSNGDKTLAYPWHGAAITATKELLESSIPKLGYNQKFEIRWSRRFGIRVRNWVWDGMLGAHVLDNRSGVTGLEFQAFALLGQEPWDQAVEPYIRSKGGGNSANRLAEAPLEQVLKYCGLDALLEYHVTRKQMKQMKQMGLEP